MSCCGIPVNSILICAQERDVEAVFLIHLALLTCGIVAWKMSYGGLRSKQRECASPLQSALTQVNDKSSVEGCVPSLSW